jgi:uncharacterized protein (UPF0332 family)
MSQSIPSEYWLEKAEADLASVRDNFTAGGLSNAVRDGYFACFHAFSAVLRRYPLYVSAGCTMMPAAIWSGRILLQL